jgi:DNA-binding MarR family transcriptional regulator
VLDTICGTEKIYQQQLSEIIMKDKSNTNRILKILEQKGLITKEYGNVKNRLVYFLKVTEEGKRIVEENMPKIKQFITEIFKNIDNSEIEILHKLSNKFQADLSEANNL